MIKRAATALVAAVGYLRMSSDKQEASPAQQKAEIEKLAKRSGYAILRWYQDLGVSGDDIAKRIGFRSMIADATKKGDFQAVLCWDISRFGRFDSLDAGEQCAPLRRAGVRLVTVADGDIDWNSFQGRVMYQISQEGKNQFLHDLSRNVTRGKYRAAQEPGSYCGPTPYGYEKIAIDDRGLVNRRIGRNENFRTPDKWQVKFVPAEANGEVEIVREIFMLYVQGLSPRAIAGRLNQRGTPAPRGARWSRTTVSNLLCNPVYVGDKVWNRIHCGKYFCVTGGDIVTKQKRLAATASPSKRQKNAESDWTVLRDEHEALVPQKLFDKAQKRLKSNVRTNFSRGNKFPLTGLVFCGHCGSSMCGRLRKRTIGGKHYAYRLHECTSHIQHGPAMCPARGVQEPYLLDFIIRQILEHIIDADFEARLRDELRSQAKATHAGTPADRKRLEGQRAQLKAKIDKGVENLLLADSADVAPMRQKLADWRAELDAIEEQLTAIQPVARSKVNVEAVVAEAMAELENLRQGLTDDDPAAARATIHQFVERVELWFDVDGEQRKKAFCRGLLILRGQFSFCPVVAGDPQHVGGRKHMPAVRAGHLRAKRRVAHRAEQRQSSHDGEPRSGAAGCRAAPLP